MSATAPITDSSIFSLGVSHKSVGDEEMAAIFSVAAMDVLETVDPDDTSILDALFPSAPPVTSGDENLSAIFSLAAPVDICGDEKVIAEFTIDNLTT